MLVAVLVRFAQRMVQLERRGQRWEGRQGQAQHREQQVEGESSYVSLHERVHSSNPNML
jgi:hypothetical protein